MNLSHLRYFHVLARRQNYTQAAHELFISQSTLSHAITALEAELDCELFEREGRSVRLTDEGELFNSYVTRSLEALEDGIGELDRRRGRLSGTVRLGAIGSIRTSFLPEAVLAYRRTRGTLIDLRIEQGSTKELAYHVRTGEIDLAITSEVKQDGYEFTPLFHQQLVCLVHKGHPLASRTRVRLSDITGTRLYTYRDDIIVGAEVNAFLESHGLDPYALGINRDSDDEMILGGLVSRAPIVGLGLDSPGLAPYPDLVLIPLEEPETRAFHAIGMLRRSGKRMNPATRDFCSFLLEFAQGYNDPV